MLRPALHFFNNLPDVIIPKRVWQCKPDRMHRHTITGLIIECMEAITVHCRTSQVILCNYTLSTIHCQHQNTKQNRHLITERNSRSFKPSRAKFPRILAFKMVRIPSPPQIKTAATRWGTAVLGIYILYILQ